MQATIHINDEVEQAFRQGYTQGYAQAKKEAAQALEKLIEKVDQAYSDAVNDSQDYWHPNTAQDALEHAYSEVGCWIDEIFNGAKDGDNRCG